MSAVRAYSFKDASNFHLLQTRPFNSLSVDTMDIIKMVTLDPTNPPKIVGSFKYIVHEYPADIDMFEGYNTCCSYSEAIKDIADKFKEMARQIKSKSHIYLGDFKAGYDLRYKINIGRISGMKLIGYNPSKVRGLIVKLHEKGLLSKEEYSTWMLKVIDEPTLSEYMDLEETIKRKYIIRWTLDEMMAGVRELSDGTRVTLENAIGQKSIVKIDLWVYLNSRYVEVTNWYMLTFTDGRGRKQYLSVEPDKYRSSLMRDIMHYNNPTVNKYMKLAKRVWLYAVLVKDRALMYKLYPLFSSGAAKMYQIVGEIDVISNILSKIEKPNMKYIHANIEDWKMRLGTVMGGILPIPVAHKIHQKLNDILSTNDISEKLFGLADVEDKLTNYVNRYVNIYFKKNHINAQEILSKK